MSNPNAELSRRWIEEVWNQRRSESIDALLDPEGVGHTEAADLRGADEFRKFQADILSTFPDLHLSIEAIVAEGDDVVLRWHASGHHSGDGLGPKASHQLVSFQGITWHRFRNGKLIEGWNYWNHLGLLQKLGS